MSNHNESLIVHIDVGDGTLREALPVRAIPYATGWDGDFGVPPWEVAIRLQTNINLHAWDISAFRVLDGKPVAVQPIQWVMVSTQLSGLSEKLHRLFPRNEHFKPSAEGVAKWQSEAAEKLPARAFVWLDELKAEYRGWLGTKFKSRPNLAIPEFDLMPLLSEQVIKMVLEGFEQATPAEHQTAQSLLDERDKLKADIRRWAAKDESQPSETLIKEKEVGRLRARLVVIEEMIRVKRGDESESKSEIIADISLQDDETGKTEAQKEFEKYRLLWRTVRLHEGQVSESIEELRRIKATTITELATRDEKLATLCVELAQIIRRKDMLTTGVDFSVNHAAENIYIIEEMKGHRTEYIPSMVTQRADEIREVNEEIDALIASIHPNYPTVQNGNASGDVESAKAEPLQIEGGLLTKEIADTFDGVNGWSADRWPKNLSSSKWLHPARIALGGAGVASAVWNPLTLAELMHSKTKGSKPKQQLMKVLNSRFNRNPVLMPWRDAFNEYFATHCATD